MSTILLLGDATTAPYARALEAEGFDVRHLVAGAVDTSTDEPDAIVIDISAAAEDPIVQRYLEGGTVGESPPLIALIPPDRLETLDPSDSLDDFLLAGATAEELCARVRRVLYQHHGVDTRNTVKYGDLVMDLANYTVHISGRPVELTYKEYELLRFLATNRGRVFTRETLLNKVWGYDFYGGARTVDVHIRRLRAKIEDRHAPFIETVRNVGYRFRTA